jgi:tol-pal system protein YbgF
MKIRPPSGFAPPILGCRIRRGGLLFVGLLVVVPLTGCSTKKDVRLLQEEIARLAERQEAAMASLEALTAATQDTIRGQSESLFSLRGETLRALNQIRDDLTILQELTGQNQRDLAAIRDQLEGGGFASGAAAGAAAGALTGLMTDSSGSAVVDVQPTAAGADAMYQAGVRQLSRGSLSAARMAFEEFLATYPSHESAASARLYLADIMVQEDDLEGALQAFLEIPELHPTSPEVPQALYRAAVIHLELGDADQARALLERVVNSYPDSGAAILAQERLREIG